MQKYKVGQRVFFLTSDKKTREARILKYSSGLYTIRFLDTGGGIRTHEYKLFATAKEAEDSVKKYNIKLLDFLLYFI